ncbi:carboxymuconolactone decarboxylase family protein [Paraburkholderia caribensis]|uniref:carboxymuconolactone decarboxylase family protein n=1 Tax=Paraburkholderia caribensis TaxID=75105 RepID=UPI001CABE0E0|nr:hypothetical protein [Paraburkholderia caribensis]CAG9269646.1 conserved hypothetical protein [Paraburkholderia caribensis]
MSGPRFAPLTYATMSAEQQAVVDQVSKGPEKKIENSMNLWLRSPGLALPLGKLSEFVRFGGVIPNSLKELVICVVARHWTAQYPWSAHYGMAAEEGISTAVLDQIAVGKVPDSLSKDERRVYDFARALLAGGEVDEAVFKPVHDQFGDAGTVELVGLVGNYTLVCMNKNVDMVPPKPGKAPRLLPLN